VNTRDSSNKNQLQASAYVRIVHSSLSRTATDGSDFVLVRASRAANRLCYHDNIYVYKFLYCDSYDRYINIEVYMSDDGEGFIRMLRTY